MQQETHFQICGMSQDLAYQLFNPKYAFECKNIRINTTDENSLLSLSNERGNKKVHTLTIENEGSRNIKILGTGQFTDYCVIFATDISNNSYDTGNDFIFLMKYDNTIGATVEKLYQGDLGFNINNPIRTICAYENERVQKVYWIDGINVPRVINIAKHLGDQSDPSTEGLKSVSEQKIDFLPKLFFNEIVNITKTSGGQFPAGVIQYAFTYSDKNLQESNIWYISPLYYITQATRGAEAGYICNVAFKLDFSHTVTEEVTETEEIEGVPTDVTRLVTTTEPALDTSFDYVQIYAILRTSLDATPSCYRIANIPTSTASFTDNGSLWESYPIESLISKQLGTFIPKTMASKDSTLFLGNYTLKSETVSRNGADMDIDVGNTPNQTTANFFDVLAANTDIDYVDGLSDSSKENLEKGSTSLQTFRSGEYYRIGIQFQDEYGTPSGVVYLKDIQVGTGQPNTGKFVQKIIKSIFPNIPEVLQSKFKRARLLMVDRATLPHRTLCQGVLCPTVYRVNDRVNNSPFAMSSWCMRGYHVGESEMPIWETDTPLWSNHVLGGAEIENQLSQNGVVIDTEDNTIIGSPDIMLNTSSPGANETTYYYGVLVRILPPSWGGETDEEGSQDEQNTLIVNTRIEVYCKRDTVLQNGKMMVRYSSTQTKILDTVVTAHSTINTEHPVYELVDGVYHDVGSEGLRQFTMALVLEALRRKGATHPERIVTSIFSNWRFAPDYDWTNVVRAYSGKAIITAIGATKQTGTEMEFTTDAVFSTFENATQLAAQIGQPFFCDHSILTFHSPDVEKYQTVIDNNPKIKYKIVGHTTINESYFDSYIQASAPATTGASQGLLNVKKITKAGLYNANLWADENTFPVYVWHRSMTLGAEKTPTNGIWHGQYTKKILANVHKCGESYTFVSVPSNPEGNPTPLSIDPIEDIIYPKSSITDDPISFIGTFGPIITEMGTPRVFNFDEVTALSIDKPKNSTNLQEKLIYYGNVNIYHSDKAYKRPIIDSNDGSITDKDNDLISDPCLIRYKSSPHVVMPMAFMRIKQNITEQTINPQTLEPEDIVREGIYAYAPSLPWPIYSITNDLSAKPTTYGYLWESQVHGLLRTSLRRNYTPIIDTDIFDPIGLLYIAELYQDLSVADIYGDSTEENLFKYSWIPISSWVPLEKDTIIQGYGDCFIGRWECLKTFAYAEDDIQSYVDITSFIVESDTNLESRYDNYKGVQNASVVNSSKFNLFNPVYNQTNNLFKYRTLTDRELIDDFQNQICWSEAKTLGEELDQWCQINVGNNTDLQGEFGELRALATNNNSIYCFQDNAIYKLNYNTRVTISPSDGVPIQLTNNYRVEPPLLLKTNCGTYSPDGVISSSRNLYFLDWIRKKACVIDAKDNIINISSDKGVDSLLTKLGAPKKALFDSNVNDIYFNFNNNTLCFNEEIGEFTSLYDYNEASFLYAIRDNTFTTKDDSIFLQRGGYFNNFFEVYKPYYVEILANELPLRSKTFTNVEFTMASDNHEEAFNQVVSNTSYQHGADVLTFNRYKPSNLKRKFRLWRLNMPRQEHSLDRMRDTWCKVKLLKTPKPLSKIPSQAGETPTEYQDRVASINGLETRVNNINITYLAD